jgi:peptide/nickel transport system permease protein
MKASTRTRTPQVPFLVAVALATLAAVLLLGVFADLIAPFDYARQDIMARLKPPAFAGGMGTHILGTDEIGRDVLSRMVYGVRVSLAIAVVGTIVGCTIGTLLGFVAGHFRGGIDHVVMTLVDFQAAIPFMIFVLAVMAIFGSQLWLFLLMVGLSDWQVYTRLVRGMVFAIREKPYYESIRAAGAGLLRVYGRHVLPNIASVLIVQMTLNFPSKILLETGLSFLGLGVQPPLPSLGLMLGTGRNFMVTAWWLPVFPGLAIFLTTLSMNAVGDWLRDRLDPTLSR